MNSQRILRYAKIAVSLILAFPLAVSLLPRTAAVSALADAPDIIIDAGHGGVDGGAVGVTGTVEKDINLCIALKLQTLLQSNGYSVAMIRTTDLSIHDEGADTIRKKKVSDLHNRLKIADASPGSLFISIHQNSFERPSVHGTMIYYGTENTESEALANLIMDEVRGLQPENAKQTKRAGSNLFLLTHCKNPAVLIECGFLTNPAEEKLLADGDYQDRLAATITAGINAYFKGRAFG